MGYMLASDALAPWQRRSGHARRVRRGKLRPAWTAWTAGPSRGPGISADGGAGTAGSSTSNTEPWPSVLLARAEPWWASAIACTIGQAEPEPAGSRLRCGSARANRWKIRSRSAARDAAAGVRHRPGSRMPVLTAGADLDAVAGRGVRDRRSRAARRAPSASRSRSTEDGRLGTAAVSRHRRGMWPHRSSASDRHGLRPRPGSRCRKSGCPAEASSSIRVASRRSRISSSVTTWASSATLVVGDRALDQLRVPERHA